MMNNKVLDTVGNHTINKFKLITTYTRDWAYKLLNYSECDGIIFIDCMCNSGKYINKDTGELIDGTAILVAIELLHAAKKYPNKTVQLFFNDYNEDRIYFLRNQLSAIVLNAPKNYKIHLSSLDSSFFLKRFTNNGIKNSNTLLIYDPYNVNIDWKALDLFINTWGEVIINHMVSDIIRNRSQILKKDVIERYENSYLTEFDNLVNIPKGEFQVKIETIIKRISKKNAFISTVPFYIKTNIQIYNLIHISHSSKGFILFKKIAWKLGGGQSAIKEKGKVANLKLLLDEEDNFDCENNYTMEDMMNHVIMVFADKGNVHINEIYEYLDNHPIFVADGFKKDIKIYLKKVYDCRIINDVVIFNGVK